MARIPKQRVIFDAEKYDLDYLRETRDLFPHDGRGVRGFHQL